MLLINDAVVKTLDPEYKVISRDYLCKFSNKKKLKSLLKLDKPLSINDNFEVYHTNNIIYKIYNASVDDNLLELLDYHFCNDEEIKVISYLHQYALDIQSCNMEHGTLVKWEKAMERQLILQNYIIKPFMRQKLIFLIKNFKNKSSNYINWIRDINIINDEKPLKEFQENFDFEILLCLVSGASSTVYGSLYKEDHKKIIGNKFYLLNSTKQLEAILEIIYTYLLNEYIVGEENPMYSRNQLITFFKIICMKMYQNKSFGPEIRIYIKLHYKKLINSFDPTFYFMFKSYNNYNNKKNENIETA